jgi:15-cis-phytoene synthase
MQRAFQYCADHVRRLDKDRFLASQFAPEPARAHVLALYAFNLEVARVRELVSNPMPGEIRLQWWRDVLSGSGQGEVSDNPVAAALLETVRRFSLPVEALLNLIEARIFDLYDDPMPTLLDLEGYAGETASALIQLAAIVLEDGADPATHEIAGHAGVAYAITGLLRALPVHATRGQCFVPKDMLLRNGATPEDIAGARVTPGVLTTLADLREIARKHAGAVKAMSKSIPDQAVPAFLPMALVEPYLRRLSRSGLDPFREIVDIPGWQRPLILWWAAQMAHA